MTRLISAATVAGAVALSLPVATRITASSGATRAQVPASVWQGVYSDEQAERGRSTYLGQSCARCHGETMVGTEFGPALVGDEFVAKWSGLSVGDLFTLIHDTMPQDNPGRLSTRQTVDIISYVLKTNEFPAGTKPLDPDGTVLKTIKIEQKSTGR